MPRDEEGFVFGHATVVRIGKAAICVRARNSEKDVWVPDSQIHDDSDLHMKSKPGEGGKLVVTKWLAEQRGWA